MKIAIVRTHIKSLDGSTKLSGVDYFRSVSPVVKACEVNGWDCDIFTGLGENPSIRDYKKFREYDLVWMSYMDNSVALKYLLDTGVTINMDFDDDFINLDPTNPVAKQYHPESTELKTLLWSLKNLPHVSMSTNHLKEAYSPIRQLDTQVLVNAIDLDEHKMYPKIKHEGIVIGWMGGITHYADLFDPAFWGAITYILGKYPDVTFSVMGMMPDLQWKDLPNFKWQDGVSDYSLYMKKWPAFIGEVDIAVCPLKDSYFNRSKSHIKAQEYASQALPIVASKVQPYIEFDKSTNSIDLCDGMGDWIASLEKLIQSQQLRKARGNQAHARVKQICLNRKVKKWGNYIKSIAKKPKISHSQAQKRIQSVLFTPLLFGGLTGSELYVKDLIVEYRKRGIEVGVWATHYNADIKELEKLLDITIYIEKPNKKYDIVHSQQVEPTERALSLGGRVIQTIHSEILPKYEFPVIGVDKYIAVRPSIEAFTMKHTNKDVVTIFNGVDTELFYKTGKSNGKVLFVGKDDYLRHDTIEELKKQGAIIMTGTQQEVAKATRECEKTASIMLGRTTIEGWHCGKPGIVYIVNEQGKIKGKQELPPPLDMYPYTTEYMAERTLEAYL